MRADGSSRSPILVTRETPSRRIAAPWKSTFRSRKDWESRWRKRDEITWPRTYSLLVRNTPDAKVVGIDAPFCLANASVQQRLTAIRLFYDFLMEEQQCSANPVGRGRYTPGRVFGGQRDRGLIPRVKKLPWIPSDDDWLALVESVRAGTSRDRFMVALAYGVALRREELCVLETTDIDPAHRVLRVRAETTRAECQRPNDE